MTIPIVRNNMPQMPVSQEYFLYRVNALSAYSIDIQILIPIINSLSKSTMLEKPIRYVEKLFCFNNCFSSICLQRRNLVFKRLFSQDLLLTIYFKFM